MVSVPRRAHILMREVDFSYLRNGSHLLLLSRVVLATLHADLDSAFPVWDGAIPVCGCVAGISESWTSGGGEMQKGMGRQPQGNRSSSRQKMKSGVGQAGDDEQWVLPEQWGQHQGLWNALIRCAHQGSAPLPTIYSRPSGRKLTSKELKYQGLSSQRGNTASRKLRQGVAGSSPRWGGHTCPPRGFTRL